MTLKFPYVFNDIGEAGAHAKAQVPPYQETSPSQRIISILVGGGEGREGGRGDVDVWYIIPLLLLIGFRTDDRDDVDAWNIDPFPIRRGDRGDVIAWGIAASLGSFISCEKWKMGREKGG